MRQHSSLFWAQKDCERCRNYISKSKQGLNFPTSGFCFTWFFLGFPQSSCWPSFKDYTKIPTRNNGLIVPGLFVCFWRAGGIWKSRHYLYNVNMVLTVSSWAPPSGETQAWQHTKSLFWTTLDSKYFKPTMSSQHCPLSAFLPVVLSFSSKGQLKALSNDATVSKNIAWNISCLSQPQTHTILKPVSPFKIFHVTHQLLSHC